jgi:hypothetical protein
MELIAAKAKDSGLYEVSESERPSDTTGEIEFKCVQNMQAILAIRDSGFDVNDTEALHQISHACTYLVQNHHIVDIRDQRPFKQAIILGMKCLTMGTLRLQSNYAKMLGGADKKDISQHVDLRVLNDQSRVDMELRYHSQIAHPYGRPQL